MRQLAAACRGYCETLVFLFLLSPFPSLSLSFSRSGRDLLHNIEHNFEKIRSPYVVSPRRDAHSVLICIIEYVEIKAVCIQNALELNKYR